MAIKCKATQSTAIRFCSGALNSSGSPGIVYSISSLRSMQAAHSLVLRAVSRSGYKLQASPYLQSLGFTMVQIVQSHKLKSFLPRAT